MEFNTLHILLVDDHSLFRDGLKFVLNDLDSHIIFSEASTCDEALDILTEMSFDLILLDLNLPNSKTMDTLSVFRDRMEASSIVILSGEDSPYIIRKSIEQGASGFIPKSSSSKVLTAALQLILNGGIYLPPNALDGLPTAPGAPAEAGRLSSDGTSLLLSERQSEVLKKAVQGKSNKIIAREMNISHSTVKSHLSQAFRALGVKNRTEAVYAVSNLGVANKVDSA